MPENDLCLNVKDFKKKKGNKCLLKGREERRKGRRKGKERKKRETDGYVNK